MQTMRGKGRDIIELIPTSCPPIGSHQPPGARSGQSFVVSDQLQAYVWCVVYILRSNPPIKQAYMLLQRSRLLRIFNKT